MRKHPWRITFVTNPDDCNLRCIMCKGHSIYQNRIKKRRYMDINLIRKVLQESTSLKEIIPSTMGEPLLFRHFDAMIEMCHEFNVKMNLTTNGTFPKYGATKWAEKIVPIGSDIKISWNGSTKKTSEKIMVGSNFEKRVQNVKDFIAIRDRIASEGGNFCQVSFQLTLMECSLKELKSTIQLAAQLGVNRIKGNHLWIFYQELKNESLKKDPYSIHKWNDAVKEAKEFAKSVHLPNGDPILLENIEPLELDERLLPKDLCPFIGKEAWVSVEGEFSPCCSPDKDKTTLGHFGSLHDQSIETIFNSNTYQDLVKNHKNYPVCKQCNMRKKIRPK